MVCFMWSRSAHQCYDFSGFCHCFCNCKSDEVSAEGEPRKILRLHPEPLFFATYDLYSAVQKQADVFFADSSVFAEYDQRRLRKYGRRKSSSHNGIKFSWLLQIFLYPEPNKIPSYITPLAQTDDPQDKVLSVQWTSLVRCVRANGMFCYCIDSLQQKRIKR